MINTQRSSEEGERRRNSRKQCREAEGGSEPENEGEIYEA